MRIVATACGGDGTTLRVLRSACEGQWLYFEMHNSAAFVEFDAFKETSAADALSAPLVGGKGQKEVPLEQCIKSFPHAGSDNSVASELPFPTVAVWRTDAVGIVRLAGVVDSVVPDVTILRFRKSGIWSRVFTIQVPRAACAAWWRRAHFLCRHLHTGVHVLVICSCRDAAEYRVLHTIHSLAVPAAVSHLSRKRYSMVLYDSTVRALGCSAVPQPAFAAHAQPAKVQR